MLDPANFEQQVRNIHSSFLMVGSLKEGMSSRDKLRLDCCFSFGCFFLHLLFSFESFCALLSWRVIGTTYAPSWDFLVPLFEYGGTISLLCTTRSFYLCFYGVFTLKYWNSLVLLFILLVVIYLLLLITDSCKFRSILFLLCIACYLLLLLILFMS